ncbi:MAG: Choline dehydrogenase [Actinomycetia bacterium]|nr:Choline dehydrogenase [Actinomycetes bacterium]
MTEYDYIIVGAGSAGCVLAARLTEDPSVKVALVEAGTADDKTEIHIPAAFPKLFKTPYDWNYSTSKQAELENRELYWPRGRTLGGSSSINAMMWVRGHQADYDGWEVPGWSYEDVVPYFKKAEHREGSNAGDVYGTGGPLWISEQRSPNPTTLAFLEACGAHGLTKLAELNGPSNEGYTQTPVTQKRGRRWSAADAYLHPAMKRPNLTVITGAHAKKVTFEGVRATGIEYGDVSLTASREVILCAGAIGSPQLLLLSGIGEASHLREHGIEPVWESPEVGQHLEDHLSVGILYNCPEKVTLVRAAAGAGALVSLAEYLLFKKGSLTSNVGEAVVFIKSDPALPAPDLELIFAPGPFINHGLDAPTAHGITVGVVLLQPDSVGRLQLASGDAADAPQIDPAYLTGETDLRRLMYGVRYAEKLLAEDALKKYIGTPMEPYPGADDDEALARHVRENSETLYHPAGTCRMGTDEASVVDPELKVRGVLGLRVVDTSVMPRINRGHTHAPTIMIAEKAADLIRR